MSTLSPSSAEEIQQQMRQVRRELNEEVQEIVEQARDLADWRHYVRRYPWICLGGAAALGYLLVPARVVVVRPTAPQPIQPPAPPPPTPSQPSWMGTVASSVANMATSALLQGGSALLRRHLENYLQSANMRHEREEFQTSNRRS